MTKKRRTKPKFPRRLKKWAPIIVTWCDAITFHEGSKSTDDFRPLMRRSTGFFLKRTPEVSPEQPATIVIAMEDDRSVREVDTDCDTISAIPFGMVREIIVLVPKPPAPPKDTVV